MSLSVSSVSLWFKSSCSFFVFLLVAIFAAAPAAAQELVDVAPLDLEGLGQANYYPSPDGRRVLYHEGRVDDPITVINVTTGETTTIALPQEEGLPVRPPTGSYFIPLQWSPDGRQFAFVGTDFVRFYEGDLWVYTFETAEWRNLTDDGYDPTQFSDVMFSQVEVSASSPLLVDSQPTWSHDGQFIAFEQTILDGSDRPASGIAIVSLETGEVRQVALLPRPDEDRLNMGTVTGLEWSLDDASLYITVFGVVDDAFADGMYELDIESGEFDKLQLPSHISQALETASGIPVENRILAAPLDLSPDGDQLLVWLGMTTRDMLYWPFIYDLASETFTPVVPFNDSGDAFGQDFAALQVAWSPDGETVLVLAVNNTDDLEVEPLLDEAEDADNLVLASYTVADGSFEVLGALPRQPVVQRFGTWGADGDALLGGFHIQFE